MKFNIDAIWNKAYIIIIIIFFSFYCPIIAADSYFGDDYEKNLKTAYNYFLKGDYLKSIKYYRNSIIAISGLLPEELTGANSSIMKISVVPEKRWISSIIGIQNCKIRIGKYRNAAEFGDKVLRLTGYNKPLILNNAYCYYLLKNYAKTVDFYGKVFKIENKNAIAVLGLFWAYYYMGEVDNTHKFLQRSLELDKNNKGLLKIRTQIEKSDYYLTMNSAYYNYLGERCEKSLKLYETSLDLAQKLSGAERLNAAIGINNCLVKKKVYFKAIIVGENILFEYPENPFTILNMAFSYYSLKEYEKSTLYYYNLHRLYPKRFDALYGLSWSYYYSKKYDKAKKYLKLAKKIVKFNKSLTELEEKLYKTNISSRFDNLFDKYGK